MGKTPGLYISCILNGIKGIGIVLLNGLDDLVEVATRDNGEDDFHRPMLALSIDNGAAMVLLSQGVCQCRVVHLGNHSDRDLSNRQPFYPAASPHSFLWQSRRHKRYSRRDWIGFA